MDISYFNDSEELAKPLFTRKLGRCCNENQTKKECFTKPKPLQLLRRYMPEKIYEERCDERQ